METIIAQITENEEQNQKIYEQASDILKRGGLVAFPTETVYGLGADALDEEASAKIYAAKGRPSDNPLIVHIADTKALEELSCDVTAQAKLLAEKFWPGPLTMIFRKSEAVPYETTGGLDTVAVRMPSHPTALALIRESGGYIAAPSANTSGRPSPTLAEHVYEDLNGKIPMILDGGAVTIGLESTIVDLTEEIPTILRPGFISLDMVQAVLGEAQIDRGLIANDSNIHPKAPGMKYRHYAPKADLKIVEGPMEQVISYINEQAEKGRTGIICTEETRSRYPKGDIKCVGTRKDELSIASHLFAVLREFDEDGVEQIYSESFKAPGLGEAIMNRLLKAAGHQKVDVSDRK